MAGAPVRALQLATTRGGGAFNATASAAAAAVTNAQQAQQTTQQSMSSLLRATQAVEAMQQAQAAARALAQQVPSGVPNGLLPGGLVPDSGLAAPGIAAPVTTWIGVNTPVQSSANGQTLVTVRQTQQKAIANWASFNVGQNTTLYFNQSAGNSSTGNSWVVLNRVQDPTGVPSQILGEIKAEGSVYVIDHNGIVFGGASQVNVASLIASSLNLFSNDLADPFSSTASDANTPGTALYRFLNGGIGDLNSSNFATNSILLTSNAPGAGDVTINAGAQINLGTQGLGLIAAPNVTNSGAITAQSGQVALVAGIGVSYDYNAASFNSNGVVTQGTNDNNTTNLRFANYGELTAANGSDITPVGTLVNNGLVNTPTGNITLLGGVIQQNGVAVATTSVQTPGSIVVTSAYEVGVAKRGAKSPADEFNGTFYTGSISFGPSAVTAILPDGNGVTLASDATSLAPFKAGALGAANLTTPLPTQGLGLIEIIGRAIDFQGGSAEGGALVYAPGQAIAADTVVLPDPRQNVPPVPGSGLILLENGAILDASGIPDTQLAATANFLTVVLGGNELADSPLQQVDALFGATVTVDMRLSGTNTETGESWVGTPLANLTNYLDLEQNTIGQLLVDGGAISLKANEFVGAPGSIINIMGGYVEYLGGTVDPTRLMSTEGDLYGIGNADPNLTYAGVAGKFTVDHTHWDVTQTFTSPLLSGSYYEPDYIQGGNAGTLNINVIGYSGALNANVSTVLPDTGAAVLDSTILGQAVAGLRQIDAATVPNDATFSFAGLLPIEIGDPNVFSAQSLAATTTPSDFNIGSPLLATPNSPYATANVFNSQALDADGFGSISFASAQESRPFQSIVVDAGTSLTVQPGGTIALNGDNITIDGTLTARGGKIDITSTPVNGIETTFFTGTGIASVPGDILIGSSATLDVSGFFVNDALADGQASALPINAGAISIIANYGTSAGSTGPSSVAPAKAIDLSGNITLAAGSVLDLEGGGHVAADGALALGSNSAPLGAGGSLTLETYAGLTTPLTVAESPLTRGLLRLDGTIDALGMSGGGTLTLQSAALQIGGDAAATPANTFYFDPLTWGNAGFGNFALSSIFGATIPAGATIDLQHANLLPNALALLGAPTGSDPAANSTVGYLTGTLASPTDLSVKAGLGLTTSTQTDFSNNYAVTLGEGAEINGQAGASVSLSSSVATTILGGITTPGGSISLSVASSIIGGPLYIGADSVLDASGMIVLDPLEIPVRTPAGLQTPVTGTIYAGGTISLSDDASSILVAPGAILNVSGTSGTFEVPQIGASGTLLRGGQAIMTSQPEWSNAGQVNINALTGLLFEGTLIGHAGAPQAEGGTLNLTGDPEIAEGLDSVIILVPDVAQALRDAGISFNFATYVPTVKLSNAANEQISTADPQLDLLFGVDSLDNSGFANLTLNTSDGGGIVGFTGKVSLNLSGSVVFNTAGVVAAEEGNYAWGFNGLRLKDGTTDGASLTVTAPYIAWNGPSIVGPNITAQPKADGTLTLDASDQIDLSSIVYLQNIGQATFNSAGDIRLLPSQVIATAQLFGYLYSAGNMSFNAATVYPVTNTAFVIQATSSGSTVSFGYPSGVGPSATTPLSADGALVVSASTIVQDGDIQAPFGSILIGTGSSTIEQLLTDSPINSIVTAVPTQSVTLGAGSVTSVSANGTVIPFGTTIDQTTWIYNPATANPTWPGATATNLVYANPLTQVPQGVVALDSASVQFDSGATVNVNGGGDLQAQEWIPGTGGSRNVLAQYGTSYQNSTAGQQVPLYPDARQIYAIDPSFNAAVAAYDPAFGSSGTAVGQSVYLAGGGGLAAGTYTLLPAQYATLPGAYRVVVNSGVTNPVSNQTVTLPDGTLQMSGYLGNALTGSRASEVAQFYVQPESVWGRYSQYALTSANQFFPAYAVANNLAAPYVPDDAGRLVLDATSSLTLNGEFDGSAAPGGAGGEVDLSAQFLEIVGNGQTTAPGYLAVSADSLGALGADSLLIGGTRQMTSSGTIITPTAKGIIVDNDAADPLAAPQILILAAPQFQSKTVALDNDGDSVSIMAPVAGTGQVTFESGSVVEALGPGSAVPVTNLVLGSTLSNLPTLPVSVDSSNASTTAGIIKGYYTDLDAALGTLVQVSNGNASPVQLPSAAQLDPGTIVVNDNRAGPNATYTITLPAFAGAGSATAATIQSGATIDGGNVLTIASTGSARLQSGATLSGDNIFAIGESITIVGSGAAPASGVVIDAGVLAGLEQASNLDLQSYGAIILQGDVNIAMANSTASLTLGGGSLAGTGGEVTISAPTLILDNTLNAPTATSGGTGSLSIDAGELIFADGAKSLSDFGAVNLVAREAAIAQGSGSMDFGALPIALQTSTLIADTLSDQVLKTTGALSIVPVSGGNAMTSDAIGGAITLEGASVTVSVPVEAVAGNISLLTSAGDIVVTGTGSLNAEGIAKAFGSATEYASAGMITLAATGGTVTLQPGSIVDFAGAATGGEGGSLTITTTGSGAPVTFGGTLEGATAPGASGSNFSLNTGGAVDLDSVAQVLTGAGVSGNISVESGAGALSLNQNLSADEVSLTADAGTVTVNSSIVANGTATTKGEIDLYGTGGVDIEGALTATGSPNSPQAGGLINIGTSGVGSTSSLNATYGYEDVTSSGTITIGATAMINAMGGTITLRAPILVGGNVNVGIAPSAKIDSAVVLDAYAVWSTADQSTDPNKHFDGIVDPAGWYDSGGNLVSGTFTDINGNTVATWTNAGGVTTLSNQDGTSNSLSYYLTNDYFTPNQGAYNSAHAVFYGGYDPNQNESFNPSSPDAGSLPGFVQNPGFNLGNMFAGIANFEARPEIDLINPSPAQGGVNGGNIKVLTNWNLGAGVQNSDGSLTLAYRYQNTIAPVVALRAAGNVQLDASISDGFFATTGVDVPNGTTPGTYANALAAYDAIESGGVDFSTLTEIQLIDGTTQSIGSLDPNVVFAQPQTGGSTLYYSNYIEYASRLYSLWGEIGPEFDNGLFYRIAAPTPAAPVPPPAADPTYDADYQTYLTTYDQWLSTNWTQFYPGGPPANGTATAPVGPADAAEYSAFGNEYENYLFAQPFDDNAVAYVYAPTAPVFVGGNASIPVAPNANLPSNMGSAADPLPIQFAALSGGQSASYQFVAGAALNSANPLALANSSNFAAGAPLAGEGNVLIDGHTVLNDLNATNAVIAVPTTIRTGTGSIDIAAAGNFVLQDHIAPGVVYTAGAPVSDAPETDGSTTIALNTGAIGAVNGNPQDTGVSTILTPEVNPANAGDITLTVQGNIVGFQDVTDTLASGTSAASGLASNPGAFLGQFWLPWLLTNPNVPSVPWYVNFGSFDQGIMSIGGNVTIRAGGDIRDLAVSLPTTSYLDASNTLHVTGGGDLSVSAGGSIYSGDFYVGQGTGAVQAGGSIAPDFTFESGQLAYPVQTLLAVQYGTITVQARGSVDIGGVYNPTYLWTPDIGDITSANNEFPVASYSLSSAVATNLVPYVTSMNSTSGVSIQATGGNVTFNSLLVQQALFNLGQLVNENDGFDPDVNVSSLLLPASLGLVALEGGITIDHGGGLYPSATGTLTVVADQSIDLAIPVLSSAVPVSGRIESELPAFLSAGNVSGTTLGKLDEQVGTGILPTGADPALPEDATQLTQAQLRDPSLSQPDDTASVLIYSLNGSLIDGEPSPASLLNTVGITVGQISLVPNAPAEIYAGQNITDLPFYGENFAAADITSITAGDNITYNIDGATRPAIIELAGPGILNITAGGNISFPSQPNTSITETGIRTLGNSVDANANPDPARVVPVVGETRSFLNDFGNPYLPTGGASVDVLFGVSPGIDYAAFAAQFLNPATAIPFALNLTWQELDLTGNPIGGVLTPAQNWLNFEALSPAQQKLQALYDFFAVLNATGIDYNNPSSPYYHQYSSGYEAINALFPAAYGYTRNDLGGGSNGANRLIETGTLDMRSSTIQSQQGGNISLLGPGGRILVGSAVAAPAANPASQGILTLESGNIEIFADQDVLVAQSRIMTEQGGDIVMWSSNGNLDAGEGAKTSVSAPPPLYKCDIDWICSADIKGQVSGAGIATLQSLPGVPVGNANLMAPRGTINAGAAGVRVSGNLNLVAVQVLNAFNIQVQGVTIGVPGTTAPNIGALDSASNAAGAAAKAIPSPARSNNNALASILIVEIEGYGGDDESEPAQMPNEDQRKKNTRRSQNDERYDPSAPLQLVGNGRLTPKQQKNLTTDERHTLDQLTGQERNAL
ncbi:MAG: filamentous hemagglutinin family protein [Pseudomonadota bacterium]